MTASPRYWAIIPAAGTSQRMGGEVSKQYLTINNTTILEASLSCFLRHPKISGVIVALHKDDLDWNSLAVTRCEKIHTVEGGETRADSVYNAVKYLENLQSEEQDFVLVHDAARPCLRYTDLSLLIDQLETEEVGGILASPVSDTLKECEANNLVSKTLDRASVWRAFTPQMFRLKHIRKALYHCINKSIPITDEASAIEVMGLAVKLVKGQSDNIKVTHTEDLAVAETILKNINQ